MKTLLCRFFTVGLIFGCSLNAVQAQTPFSTQSHVLHGGFGIGGYGISYGFGIGTSSTPIISVTYDQGIIDNLGIGNLGIGGGMGIKYYNVDNSNANFSRIFVGARGTYHFDFVNSDNFDFYAGAMLGVSFFSNDNSGFNNGTDLFAGPIAGINYWFSPTFGVYGEAGYGLGILNGGVCFNF